MGDEECRLEVPGREYRRRVLGPLCEVARVRDRCPYRVAHVQGRPPVGGADAHSEVAPVCEWSPRRSVEQWMDGG